MLAGALVASLLLAGGPYAGAAHACTCAGVPTVERQLAESDAVFSGEMVRGGLEDPVPKDGTMVGGIEFRVDESWKGVSGGSAVVYGQDTIYYGKLDEDKMYVGSSCAYPFEKGERYLVYASRTSTASGWKAAARRHRWLTRRRICGSSVPQRTG